MKPKTKFRVDCIYCENECFVSCMEGEKSYLVCDECGHEERVYYSELVDIWDVV